MGEDTGGGNGSDEQTMHAEEMKGLRCQCGQDNISRRLIPFEVIDSGQSWVGVVGCAIERRRS